MTNQKAPFRVRAELGVCTTLLVLMHIVFISPQGETVVVERLPCELFGWRLSPKILV